MENKSENRELGDPKSGAPTRDVRRGPRSSPPPATATISLSLRPSMTSLQQQLGALNIPSTVPRPLASLKTIQTSFLPYDVSVFGMPHLSHTSLLHPLPLVSPSLLSLLHQVLLTSSLHLSRRISLVALSLPSTPPISLLPSSNSTRGRSCLPQHMYVLAGFSLEVTSPLA